MSTRQPRYRVEAFGHWLNLLGLVAGGVAGAVIDPALWMLLVPAELAYLWVMPDLPPFRAWVDKRFNARELARERTYYLEQLWGLRPHAATGLARVKRWFVDVDDETLDDRIVARGSEEHAAYVEMRTIVKKLRELLQVRGVHLVESEIGRFEQVINGYLRLLISCDALAKALDSADAKALARDVAELRRRLESTDAQVRPALLERLRLQQGQLDRLPKVQATLELFKTRASSILYQLRNIHGQALADPGMDVNALLEDTIEKHDMLVDPIGALEGEQLVRDFLATGEREGESARRTAARAAQVRERT